MKDFPLAGVVPKTETQAADFVAKNPTYDGRGTVIAILDTGVDPGAVGLRTTTTGLPKCLHLIDCTGSGDVPCTTVQKATPNSEGQLTLRGLTGRTLIVPSSWPSPRDGAYRLGWKGAAGLFPDELVDEMKEERRRLFRVEQDRLVTELEEKAVSAGSAGADEIKSRIEALKDQMKNYEDPGIVFDCVVFHTGEYWVASVDVTETGDLSLAPLLSEYSVAQQFASFGTATMLNFSINVYDEGETLSIVTCSGTHGTHVASIAAANHPDDPKLNGVAPGAQIISLKIADSRLHSMETGTGFTRAAAEICRLRPDVANISFGEATASNEIGRIVELLRDECVNKAGCIILSSAGNSGPVLSSVSHPGGISGIITVGAYQSAVMQDSLYMLLQNVPDRPHTWSSQGPSPDGHYGVDIYAPGAAFTSVPQYTKARGQMMNGTSMACPNAAGLTALLVSGLKQSFLPYNPYRIALALRNTAKSIGDPFGVGLAQVHRAWDHLTTIRPATSSLDVFYSVKFSGNATKRGIYLRELDEASMVQRKAVSVTPVFWHTENPATNPIKQQYETHLVFKSSERWITAPEFAILPSPGREFLVNVDPTHLPTGVHYGEIQAFDSKLPDAGPLFKIPVTVCKPDVSSPNAVGSDVVVRYPDLKFGPGTIVRKFVAVPPTANFAELVISSKERIGSGRIFIHSQQMRHHSMQSTYEQFWAPSFSSTTSGLKDDESYFKKVFPVLPGVTTELVLGQMWSSIGDTHLSIELIFHGLELSASILPNSGAGTNAGGDLIMLNTGNNGVSRVDVRSTLRKETVTPAVSLNVLRKAIRPTSAEIKPLPPRYTEPDSRRLRELVLTYSVKLTEESTVTPFLPLTKHVLYDSIFNNYLIQVFDGQKALKSMHEMKAKSTKLGKGTYTVKVQLISVDVDLLEGLKGTPLTVDTELAKPVSLSLHPSLGDMLRRSGKVKTATLERGESLTFWISPLEGSAVPKAASPGDLLLGKFDLAGEPNKVTVHRVAYVVPVELKEPEKKALPSIPGSPKAPKPAAAAAKEAPAAKPDGKENAAKLKEAVRDLEISWLTKLSDSEERTAVLERLREEHPAHLPVYVAALDLVAEELVKAEDAIAATRRAHKEQGTAPAAAATSVTGDETDGGSAAETKAVIAEEVDASLLERVEAAADAVLGRVDTAALAMYYGARAAEDALESGSDEAAKAKKERDAEKAAVQSALAWKARIAKWRLVASPAEGASDNAPEPAPATGAAAAFDASLNALAAWLPSPPTKDDRYLRLWAWRLRRMGRLGAALLVVNKHISDADVVAGLGAGGEDGEKALKDWRELVEMKREMLEELGWALWSRYEERWAVVRAPPAYAPF
ncbi:subtilase family-domain-containing protein [Zopfochytrium polystomum]|nr:subtilase family-domain-containing protein [Zopfochytrium polystomum]